MNLMPRGSTKPAESKTTDDSSSRSSIFGAAKPREEVLILVHNLEKQRFLGSQGKEFGRSY
jgi:hypothetical protein